VPALDVTIPGAIDPEVAYDVTAYIDANGNGVYDNPAKKAGDSGYKTQVPSTAQGLSFTFDPQAAGMGDVDVGPP
jgi:hypothetical protein